MKICRLLALTLALLMCITSLALPAFADGEETEETEETTTTTTTTNQTGLSEDYKTKTYTSLKEKVLNSMELVYTDHGYELYYQAETGEVAIINTATKQILSTNPYDIADANNKETEKERLLSQLVVTYDDNGEEKTMNSYASAALLNQIKMQVIRGGIRVEYTIGKATSKRTIPFMIEKTRFEEMILTPLRESGDTNAYDKLKSYYVLRDPEDPTLSENERQTLYNTLPATRTVGAIYVLESTVAEVERELNMFEKWILQYTKYTYDDVLKDHEQTGYTGATKTPAVFRMALEYYVTEDGLEVRLPASGIRYDSSMYSLTNIQILPLFGAYDQSKKGYVLLPDGSGTLVRFEDSEDTTATTITSRLYGEDFSYYTQKVVANMQPWVLPVFGMVETTETTSSWWDPVLDENGEPVVDETGEQVYEQKFDYSSSSQGFMAIITEGDSLLDVSTASGGLLNRYFTAYTIATPRPTDTYPLDGISVSGGTATWTVHTEKKYTGSYRIKYIMLNEEEATYVNMAKLYREYLEKQELLSKNDDNKKSINLFLETFGAIETSERRFGVPVDVMKDLTSFDNAKLMIDELDAVGIDNLSVKYRGWANGGLDSTAPTRIKVESVLGGKKGLNSLIEYAKEKDITIFPDFDYTYVSNFSSGDKFDVKDETAKTVDNRSAVHRSYDPVYQAFMNDSSLIISSGKILDFWRDIEDKYSEFNIGAVSFATLGSDLNSDHKKGDSLNREDAKERITEFLTEVKNDGYEIMVDQGNSYVLGYADNILNLPLDSSNRYVASESVPFYGMVLHGYKNFSGEAINLAGDYTYSVLKTIENGADPYFILSYDNANALKTSLTYSKYYSIRYDIWKADLIETYHTLNLVLAGVKDSVIANHEFVNSRRVVVTYENGTSFDIDYSTSILIVKEEGREYVINFAPETYETFENTVKVTYAVYELDGVEYEIPVESGESSTMVIEDGKAYSIKDFLVENGCVLEAPVAENN